MPWTLISIVKRRSVGLLRRFAIEEEVMAGEPWEAYNVLHSIRIYAGNLKLSGPQGLSCYSDNPHGDSNQRAELL